MNTLPMPRMKICVVSRLLVKDTLGTASTTSASAEVPRSLSLLPLSTVIASGVMSSAVSRFSAVIITRSSCSGAVSAGALAGGLACDIAAPPAPSSTPARQAWVT
jgi:hypothetical protein